VRYMAHPGSTGPGHERERHDEEAVRLVSNARNARRRRVRRTGMFARILGRILMAALLGGRGKLGKRALDNSTVRTLAIGLAVGAVCATVVLCLVGGIAAGAALGAANRYVNHRRENLANHLSSGAVEGLTTMLPLGGLGRLTRGLAPVRRFSVIGRHNALPLKRKFATTPGMALLKGVTNLGHQLRRLRRLR